jgi:hypothetical protein
MFLPRAGSVDSGEVRLDRKYRQHGYQDSGKPEKRDREQRPKEQQHPRPPRQEQIGPRTPRMVGTVLHARCGGCGNILPHGFDAKGLCPKCGYEIHCCKMCVNFDTGAQFECTQPIPEPILKKTAKNNCTFFELRMTVEKDTAPVAHAPTNGAQKEHSSTAARPGGARQAFEDLFKK